ncbi:IclR family transcriptional regulator [Arthrobacter sp. NPDC055138]
MRANGRELDEFTEAPAIFRPTMMHGAATEDEVAVAPLLARAVALLRCFTQAEYTLSAKDLVERSGIPRSTVHRLIGDLVSLGLLTRTSGGRYCVGSLVWELAQHSSIQLHLRHAAQVHLTRLYDASGENIFLGVMTTDVPETAEVMYVGHVKGPQSARTNAQEGRVFPLLATAMGVALTAARPKAWREQILRRLHPRDMPAFVNQNAGDDVLEQWHRRGYAVQIGEGSVAIAAPILADEGYSKAAVEMVVAPERWDERRLAPLIRSAVAAIARDLQKDE